MPSSQAASRDVHVCLISDQPIPNLLPLLLDKPAEAIFLVSPEKTAQAELLKKVVQPHGIRVAIEETSAYDFDTTATCCEKLLNNGGALTLNVTGGTKIAALAAFQAFYFDNRRIIYCDTEHDQILQLAPERRSTPISDNLIKVRDYLACYGIPRVSGGETPAGAEKRRAHLTVLASLLIRQERLLGKFNSALERQDKKPYADISLNELGDGGEYLSAVLTQCEIATLAGSGNLHIPSKEKIFFCKGGWLEEYVYWTIRGLGIKGLNAAMNVKVKWDGKGRQPTENEFDVLFTHRNRLHLVSCKASNPERVTTSGTRATEALNEVKALKERAGGLFGKPMLVSARRLRAEDRERASKMEIKLVDAQEVLRLKEHFYSWLDNPKNSSA